MSTRWQHKVVGVPVEMFGNKAMQRAKEALEKLSVPGWQLVAVDQPSSLDSIRLYLKRPV